MTSKRVVKPGKAVESRMYAHLVHGSDGHQVDVARGGCATPGIESSERWRGD